MKKKRKGDEIRLWCERLMASYRYAIDGETHETQVEFKL